MIKVWLFPVGPSGAITKNGPIGPSAVGAGAWGGDDGQWRGEGNSGAWNGGWGGDDDGQWKGDNGKNNILQLKWIWTKFVNSGAWNGGWGGNDGQWNGDGDDGSWKGEGGKSYQTQPKPQIFHFNQISGWW